MTMPPPTHYKTIVSWPAWAWGEWDPQTKGPIEKCVHKDQLVETDGDGIFFTSCCTDEGLGIRRDCSNTPRTGANLESAATQCESQGGRLCTADEVVVVDEVRGRRTTATQGCSVDGPRAATGADLNRHWTSTPCTPPMDLWDQHLEDRHKCNNNIDVQFVSSQQACQQLAVANGHEFYSFRHNAGRTGHKCMSSATCDSPLDDRTNEWNIYRSIPGAGQYVGCFKDDRSRDLGAMVGNTNAATNTFQGCRAACGDHKYMSLQYGGECFCANSYGNGPQYTQEDDGNCNSIREPCFSSSFNCGGTWHQAIYQINPRECQHLPNQDVTAGTFEHYGLDYSNSPSDHHCSATCTANRECTAWVRQPSTGSCWISRQSVVTFEADRDRTTGLRCDA